MATQNTLTIRNIRVNPTKLGRYTTQLVSAGNKQIAQQVRNNWRVGEVFTARTGNKYQVHIDGSLRHT